jgi:hypothetical protein
VARGAPDLNQFVGGVQSPVGSPGVPL